MEQRAIFAKSTTRVRFAHVGAYKAFSMFREDTSRKWQ